MKLENRKQKVAPLSTFFRRLGRYGLFAFMLIAFSVALGSVGYHHFGALNWLDSFHMSCMILAGMGPVSDMKTADAKIFSSLYALYSGVAFLTIAAVFFTPLIHRLLHILQIETED